MNIRNYIQNSLANLNLTKGEARLYVDILQSNGQADTHDLIRISKYSPAGVYKLLDSLIEKGFILRNDKVRPAKYIALPLQNVAKKIATKGRRLTRVAAN